MEPSGEYVRGERAGSSEQVALMDRPDPVEAVRTSNEQRAPNHV